MNTVLKTNLELSPLGASQL